MRTYRQNSIKRSNNKVNPRKNICALAVASKLKVDTDVRYLHNIYDVVRASRKKYTVRSRKSFFKGKTVGAIRKEMKKIECKYLIVRVADHVILLDNQGNTIVDTAARKRDKRKVTHIYAVI